MSVSARCPPPRRAAKDTTKRDYSLMPKNVSKLFAVRIINATVLSGIAAGSFPVLDIDFLRVLVSIAASEPSTRSA